MEDLMIEIVCFSGMGSDGYAMLCVNCMFMVGVLYDATQHLSFAAKVSTSLSSSGPYSIFYFFLHT